VKLLPEILGYLREAAGKGRAVRAGDLAGKKILRIETLNSWAILAN